MTFRLSAAVSLLIVVSLPGSLCAAAPQAPASSSPAPAAESQAVQQRAEIYYDLTMGHVYETQYAVSSQSDDATQAIDFYKKAYALDPSSSFIGEQLAEMYLLAQRTRDAVNEAQAVLQRDPNDLAARRLLARIYLRNLGDLSNTSNQASTINLAMQQLKEIVRLDPSDQDSALWLARLYQLTNQPDQAEQLLRKELGTNADNQEAVSQLAQLLTDENKSDAAIALLQQSLQQAPNAGLYDQLGDIYAQMHDASHAEQAYRQSVQLEPAQAAHRQRLAQSLMDQGKYQDALGEYQRLTQLDPQDASNYLHQAEAYRALHQLSDAEKQILLAKQHAPDSLEVMYNEAAIYEGEGRYDDAVRVLTDAITGLKAESRGTPSDNHTLSILYQFLGQVYRDQQNYPAAVNTFQEMVNLGPDEDRRARALIIDTYRANRDMPDAMDAARRALAQYPKDRGLLISQALLYGENNQPDQAAQILKPLLDNSSADLEIYLNLAEVYEETKRFSDAEQALQQATKFAKDPGDRENINFLLGGVYERSKRYEQAEQEFKDVIAQNPDNAPALNYYGYMLADRGTRLDEAVSLVQRALAVDPNNAAYLDSIGWAYYKQNKLADAEENLRKAVQLDSHDPTILSHLGDVLAKSGRTDLAAAEWEKSLEEWHHALPAEYDPEKASEVEQKIAGAKKVLAQRKSNTDEKTR